jgi:hypothetical protein
MSPSPFRALLLALALVVQAIAGGASVARATSMETGLGLTQHCLTRNAPSPDQGERGPTTGGAHLCHDCCLCGGPLAFSPQSYAGFAVALRVPVRVDAPPVAAIGAPARLAHAPPARGPPAA